MKIKIKSKIIMTFIQENAATISLSGYYQETTNISFMQEKFYIYAKNIL